MGILRCYYVTDVIGSLFGYLGCKPWIIVGVFRTSFLTDLSCVPHVLFRTMGHMGAFGREDPLKQVSCMPRHASQ